MSSALAKIGAILGIYMYPPIWDCSKMLLMISAAGVALLGWLLTLLFVDDDAGLLVSPKKVSPERDKGEAQGGLPEALNPQN